MSSRVSMRRMRSCGAICGVRHSWSARSPNTLLGTLRPCTTRQPAARHAASPPPRIWTSRYPIAPSVAAASGASVPSASISAIGVAGAVTGLLPCFTERASYTDNFFGEHTGQQGLREMFARMFREGRDYVWRMDHVVETPGAAAAEWTFSYVVTDAVPRSAGRKVRFRGMSIFELEGGRIARYREYFDTGVALLQLGFTPEAIAKVLGRRTP